MKDENERQTSDDQVVNALLALLRTHPSDLAAISEIVGNVREFAGTGFPEDDLPFVNRLLATAAAAGVPTEAQIQAIATHAGLKTSPMVATAGGAHDDAEWRRLQKPRQQQTPQSRADNGPDKSTPEAEEAERARQAQEQQQ